MRIIKLDAIPSTNDFLKEMAASGSIEPYTVAFAHSQTRGRGQAGSRWVSEPGKNLTFSVYVPGSVAFVDKLFGLNVAVTLAVLQVLDTCKVPRLSVKWPNDILSGNKKMAGILIENLVGQQINSVVGIGVNVNQRDFDGLPSASSILVETGIGHNLEKLLQEIVGSVRDNLAILARDQAGLWEQYHRRLYMAGKAAMFEDSGGRFMAVVRGVSAQGQLELEFEDGNVRCYAVREVRMVY